MADYGGAWGCQCSVEDCQAVVGIVSLDLPGDALAKLRDIRERSVAIRHELRRNAVRQHAHLGGDEQNDTS